MCPRGAASGPYDGYFLQYRKQCNLQVDDLNGVLDRLRDEDVAVDTKREKLPFWEVRLVHRSEGNRVEL
jgi:hypothetical protein